MLSLKEAGFKDHLELESESIAVNLPILIIVNFENEIFIINLPPKQREYYVRKYIMLKLKFEGYLKLKSNVLNLNMSMPMRSIEFLQYTTPHLKKAKESNGNALGAY